MESEMTNPFDSEKAKKVYGGIYLKEGMMIQTIAETMRDLGII